MYDNQYVSCSGSASQDCQNNFSILSMSTIKTRKVHPHGVMTMDMYFDHITEVVHQELAKLEDDKESSDDNFSNEIYNDSNGTERVHHNEYLDSEYNVIGFSNQYNYYNYYNAKSLFITIKMNNMNNLSIPLMTKQETKQVSKYKPYIKSVEFTEGVRKAYFVINIEMIEQSFKGVVKMEDFTTVDLATGKETEGTRPLKGYELTLVDKDDPDRKARLLSVNKSEGVSFIDELVKERKAPIGTFIAGEEIELERVQNDFGYNPSILPVGA